MKEAKQYRFSVHINQRAIKQHLETKKYSISKMNYERVCILSFIIDCFKKGNTSLARETIHGKSYVFFSDNLFYDNLIFISYKKRTLKSHISELKNLGFIDREIKNRNARYLRITDDFSKILENKNNSFSPLQYLMKYDPEYFKLIKRDFEPYLNNFKELTERFNDNYDINGEEYDTKKIYHKLNGYLTKCLNNKRY